MSLTFSAVFVRTVQAGLKSFNKYVTREIPDFARYSRLVAPSLILPFILFSTNQLRGCIREVMLGDFTRKIVSSRMHP